MKTLATPDVITFDCYGTLVQWDGVLIPAIEDILARQQAPSEKAGAVLTAFHTHSLQAQQQPPYRDYRTIVCDGFAAALAEHGVHASDADLQQMVDALATARPHPEVVSVLRQLKQHCKLGIITNSDDQMVGPCVQRLGVPIDFLITAQQARAYKPSPQIFNLAHRTMNVARERIVHVAMSMALDISACSELGMRSVWINRRQLTGAQRWKADAVLPDLSDLPSLLSL